MAVRTVSIPLVFGLDADARRIFGALTLTGDVNVESRALPWTTQASGPPFRWLARATLQVDTVLGRVDLASHVIGGLRALRGIEVHYAEPTGSTLRFRAIVNGVNQYWNGVAWAAATLDAHWNTAVELAARLPSIDIANARLGLSVAVKLTAAVAGELPTFYGVTGIADVMFAESSISTTRGASQRAELVTAIVADLRANLSIASAEEFKSDGIAAIDMTPAGDYAVMVIGIDAVWNLTSDPGMDAPLAHTFVGGTLTLAVAPTSGHTLRIARRIRPTVTEGGDLDVVTDTLPAILVRHPRELESRRSLGAISAAEASDSRLVMRGPVRDMLEVVVAIKAESPGEVDEILEQLREYCQPTGDGSPRLGRTIRLATTGHTAVLRWAGVRENLGQSGDAWQTSVGLVVSGFSTWLGTAASAPMVTDTDLGP